MQTNSMKPRCDLPKWPTVLRSQRAEIGRPNFRSSSPWEKNSSDILCDHLTWESQGKAEWPMSPPLRHICAKKRLSASLSMEKSWVSRRILDFEMAWKCSDMSVLNISSMIWARRGCRSCSRSLSSKPPASSSLRAWKQVAACIFSSTLASLYTRERAWLVLMQKELFRPKCLRSWQRAARTKAPRSSARWCSANPKLCASQLPPWHTCAAWMALW
mmetsp:Transcript_97113/g.279030  ORF Transcript_97113/g.279030 Transcript_97113/m.279030 type:complete len:216 (-) Transcript_97113:2182-2829(-)